MAADNPDGPAPTMMMSRTGIQRFYKVGCETWAGGCGRSRVQDAPAASRPKKRTVRRTSGRVRQSPRYSGGQGASMKSLTVRHIVPTVVLAALIFSPALLTTTR